MKKNNKVKRSVQLKRFARKVYSKLKAKAADKVKTEKITFDEAKQLLNCNLPLIRTRIGRK